MSASCALPRCRTARAAPRGPRVYLNGGEAILDLSAAIRSAAAAAADLADAGPPQAGARQLIDGDGFGRTRQQEVEI